MSNYLLSGYMLFALFVGWRLYRAGRQSQKNDTLQDSNRAYKNQNSINAKPSGDIDDIIDRL